MKIEVRSGEIVVPPKEIVVTLSEREAAYLVLVLGLTNDTGQENNFLYDLYDQLNDATYDYELPEYSVDGEITVENND